MESHKTVRFAETSTYHPPPNTSSCPSSPSGGQTGSGTSDEDRRRLLARLRGEEEPQKTEATSGGDSSDEDRKRLLARLRGEEAPQADVATPGGDSADDEKKRLLARLRGAEEPKIEEIQSPVIEGTPREPRGWYTSLRVGFYVKGDKGMYYEVRRCIELNELWYWHVVVGGNVEDWYSELRLGYMLGGSLYVEFVWGTSFDKTRYIDIRFGLLGLCFHAEIGTGVSFRNGTTMEPFFVKLGIEKEVHVYSSGYDEIKEGDGEDLLSTSDEDLSFMGSFTSG